MEQMYHDLESSFYELQKTMKALKEGHDKVSEELEEERKRNAQLQVAAVFLREA